MSYEWDPAKRNSNIAKHGVDFSEASTVFLDPYELTCTETRHSYHEDRYFTIGYTDRGRLVTVFYTERQDATRIISARPASAREAEIYDQRRH